MVSSTLFFSCEICVPEHGPYQFQENRVAGQIRMFTVLHLVCLVLMVAMVPHPCPFPIPFPCPSSCLSCLNGGHGAPPMPLPHPPSPFFHQVQAAEQLACTCGKKGRGRGRGTLVSVCTKLCSLVAPTMVSSTLFFLVKSVCQNMVLLSFKKIGWLGKSGCSLSFILFVLS